MIPLPRQYRSDPIIGLEQMNAEEISLESVNSLDMEEYDNIWERDPTPVSEAPGTPDSATAWGAGGSLGFESPDIGLENILSSGVSLRDHLLNQIQMELANPIDRMIAVYLTDQLDNCGRLPDELEATAHRLGCTVKRVADVLHRIQEFDPPGIFARSLEEGWAIQLREKNRLDPAMATLLDNIELLKQQEDPINGGNLFDHTMILYGCGMATGTHSTRNMPLVLAGGGFKLGEHRVYPEEKEYRVKACNLLLSMLQNFGLEIDRFGTSTGTLAGLEWS